MLRQQVRWSFSPFVMSGKMLAFSDSKMEVLRGTGLGGGSDIRLFARKNKTKQNIQAHKLGVFPTRTKCLVGGTLSFFLFLF